jgi:glycosyltransferase involved in cell wall biosynthesis
VIDDCSTDSTSQVVDSVRRNGIDARALRNVSNSGHGPSTLRALEEGMKTDADLVVAVDGDGQFYGSDLARVVQRSVDTGCDVVEGDRRNRGDPLYRRAVSLTTRLLVFVKSRKFPRDANTPLRVYRPEVLRRLLEVIDDDCVVPNLAISAHSRRWGLRIESLEVQSIPRRGADKTGTTWGKSRRQLPSQRFVKFCVRAIRDFARV